MVKRAAMLLHDAHLRTALVKRLEDAGLEVAVVDHFDELLRRTVRQKPSLVILDEETEPRKVTGLRERATLSSARIVVLRHRLTADERHLYDKANIKVVLLGTITLNGLNKFLLQ